MSSKSTHGLADPVMTLRGVFTEVLLHEWAVPSRASQCRRRSSGFGQSSLSRMDAVTMGHAGVVPAGAVFSGGRCGREPPSVGRDAKHRGRRVSTLIQKAQNAVCNRTFPRWGLRS